MWFPSSVVVTAMSFSKRTLAPTCLDSGTPVSQSCLLYSQPDVSFVLQDLASIITFKDLTHSALRHLSLNTTTLCLKIDLLELLMAPLLEIVEIGCRSLAFGPSTETEASMLAALCMKTERLEFSCMRDFTPADKELLQGSGFSFEVYNAVKGYVQDSSSRYEAIFTSSECTMSACHMSCARIHLSQSPFQVCIEGRDQQQGQWPQEMSYDCCADPLVPKYSERNLLTAPVSDLFKRVV